MNTAQPISLAPQDQVHDVYRYVTSAPAAGGSASIAGRVSVTLKSQVSHVIASQQFPFKNESDLVRAAVHWFMDTVIAPKTGDKKFQDDFRRMSAFVRNAQRIARLNNTNDFLRETKKAIESLIGGGSLREAAEVYRDALTEARSMTEPARSRAIEYLTTNIDIQEARREAENWESVMSVEEYAEAA